ASSRLAETRGVIDLSAASDHAEAIPRLSFPEWLPAVLWLAGAAIGTVALLTGLGRMFRLTRASHPLPEGPWTRLAEAISNSYRIPNPVLLLLSRNPSILVTWGLFRPKVILPSIAADWTEERAGIVLRHELAHIRRRDLIVQMTAQALRIIYWFNPLV